MTANDLKSIRYIKRELDILHDELKSLREKSLTKSCTGATEPSPAAGDDFVFSHTKKIIDKENLIKSKERKLRQAEDFIDSIDDGELRIIVRQRVLNGLTWNEIGKRENMDRRTASRKFYDFVKLPTM